MGPKSQVLRRFSFQLSHGDLLREHHASLFMIQDNVQAQRPDFLFANCIVVVKILSAAFKASKEFHLLFVLRRVQDVSVAETMICAFFPLFNNLRNME
jgi:hypothetical protein